MNLRKSIREKGEVHTSALNDILFILLFFFLIVATLANPNVVKLANPKAKSDTKAKQSVVVSINGQQQFFIGTTPVSIDSLQPALAQVLSASQEAEKTVVINADSISTAGSIVAVMRAAQALKVKTVMSVARP